MIYNADVKNFPGVVVVVVIIIMIIMIMPKALHP